MKPNEKKIEHIENFPEKQNYYGTELRTDKSQINWIIDENRMTVKGDRARWKDIDWDWRA